MSKVLVVEDDPVVQAALVHALTDLGHVVQAVGTAVAALREAGTNELDLVILDLGLPDLDGVAALRMLRGVSNVPVIVATARGAENSVVSTLNAGADDYIVKPFSSEHLAARINARFGNRQWKPIVLLRQHQEPPVVFRYYRAADLCYVSSLDDGMNLVAKEFVAARDDRGGVLVLSSFAGAARELTGALIVNPYDIDGMAEAIRAAVAMPVEERRARMARMRQGVREHNIYRWAGLLLSELERIPEPALGVAETATSEKK